MEFDWIVRSNDIRSVLNAQESVVGRNCSWTNSFSALGSKPSDGRRLILATEFHVVQFVIQI